MAVCDKYHLEYFGIAGTGIGAVRHKGFIPWDDDIDIAMPRHDFDKFIKIIQKTMGDKYLVLNGKNYPGYPLMTTRLVKRGTVFAEKVMKDVDCPFGIFLDLYVLDNVSDNPVLYQIQSWEAWFYSKLLIFKKHPGTDSGAEGDEGEAHLVCLQDGSQGTFAALHQAGGHPLPVRAGLPPLSKAADQAHGLPARYQSLLERGGQGEVLSPAEAGIRGQDAELPGQSGRDAPKHVRRLHGSAACGKAENPLSLQASVF